MAAKEAAGGAGVQPAGRADPSWYQLSDEVKLMIFSYLDHRSLALASAVCHDWRRVCGDDRFWVHLVQQGHVELPFSAATSDANVFARRKDGVELAPRLALLACPKRAGQTLRERLHAIEAIDYHLMHRQRVRAPLEVAPHPDLQILGVQTVSDLLVALWSDGFMRAYSVETMREVAVSAHAHKEPPVILVRESVGEVQVSAYDRFAVSLDASHAYVWHLPSLELCCVFSHPGVRSACVSADACHLATWSDAAAVVWHLHDAVMAGFGVPVLPGNRSTSTGAGGAGIGRRLRQGRVGSHGSRRSSRRRHSGSQQSSARSSISTAMQSEHRTEKRLQRLCVAAIDERVHVAERIDSPEQPCLALPADFRTSIIEAGFLFGGERVAVLSRHHVEVWRVFQDDTLPVHLLRNPLPWASRLDTWTLAPSVLRAYAAGLRRGIAQGSCRVAVSLVSDAMHESMCSTWPTVTKDDHTWSMFDGQRWWRVASSSAVVSPQPGSKPRIAWHRDDVRDEMVRAQVMHVPHEQLPWWRNQRVHLLSARSAAYLAPDRSVVVSRPLPDAAPIKLQHFPHDEHPDDLFDGQDTVVTMAVSLPYLFTAGGPFHSIRRWNLSRREDDDAMPAAWTFRLLGAVTRAVRAWHTNTGNVVAMAVVAATLTTALLLHIKLDALVPGLTHLHAVAPFLVLAALVYERDVALVAGASRGSAAAAAIVYALAACLIVWTPLTAALRADGVASLPWWLVLVPVVLAAAVAILLILAVLLLDDPSAEATPLHLHHLVQLISGVPYLACTAAFLVAHAIAVDYPAATAIPRAHTWTFLWAGAASVALVHVVALPIALAKKRRHFGRPGVTFLLMVALMTMSQVMLYHAWPATSTAAALIPADLVLLRGLVWFWHRATVVADGAHTAA